MATVEFFYDYVSPYTYLANSQVGNLEADVAFRPMLLGAVMQATDNRPPREVVPKRAYLTADLKRWAHRYGVPFEWPSVFPQKTVTALRLAIAAGQEGCFDAVHQPLFDAVWCDGRDLGDVTVLTDILQTAGLDAETMLQRAVSDDIKSALRANTDEALARGVFGAPTFFVGDEMFFGNDRFDFVEEALAKAG